MLSRSSHPMFAKRLAWAFLTVLVALSALALVQNSTAASSETALRNERRAAAFITPGSAQLFANPQVAQMISGVTQSDVHSYTSQLTGKTPLTVGGQSFTMSTRNLEYYPGYLTKATQYVYEFMQARGLQVSYQNWSSSAYGVSSRNVIGEIRGTTHPEQIVLITAHIDDMPNKNPAPGADDNASGVVAVMQAAARLAGHSFDRTIRFVIFTGEEIDYLGSVAYAKQCAANHENIVGVLNLDMIAYDGNNDGLLLLHIRKTTNAGYAGDRAIADTFVQVVSAYGLTGITPQIWTDGEGESDHVSFWAIGVPAILAIEDDWYDLNPYYHTQSDTIDHLNMGYFTNFVKAAVGTAAHLAIPAGSGSETATPTRTQTPAVTRTATPTRTRTPTATAIVVAPAKPILVSPRNDAIVNTRRVPLDWSDASGATYYKLQVWGGKDGNTLVDRQSNLKTSQYTTVALPKGKWYWWRVRACIAQTCSAWTAYWDFKVRTSATQPSQ